MSLESDPTKLTPHVRTYYFGERIIPEGLVKTGISDVRVAESREIPDYREAPAAAFCSSAWGKAR